MSNLNTSTAEADARFVKIEAEPQNGLLEITRAWRYTHPSSADTLIVALAAVATYTNPKVDNETYTGTFTNSLLQPRQNGERAIDIIQTVMEISTPADATELAALTPIIIQKNGIRNTFGLNLGEFDELTYIYPNINPAAGTQTVLMTTITKAELVAALAVGWTYQDRTYKQNDDNTAEFSVFFRKETWGNESSTTPDIVIDTRTIFGHRNYDPQNDNTGLDRKKIDGGTGIPTDKIVEILGNEAADSGFVIDNIDIIERRDGESDLRKTQTKLNASNSQYQREFIPANGRQDETEVLQWKNISTSNKDTLAANWEGNKADMPSATPASPANHVLKKYRPIDNGNESWDVTRTTYIPRVTIGTVGRLASGTIAPFKMYYKTFHANDGTRSATTQIVRVDRLVTTVKGDASNFADLSADNPQVTNEGLGSWYFDERYAKYVAFKVLLFAATSNFAAND